MCVCWVKAVLLSQSQNRIVIVSSENVVVVVVVVVVVTVWLVNGSDGDCKDTP